MSRHPIDVVELRGTVTAERLAALPPQTRLQWRDPLAAPALDAIARRSSGGTAIRLYGSACAQIDDVLERIPVRRLAFDARRVRRPPRAPGVRELAIEGVPNDATFLHAFDSLEALRVDAHGAPFDLRVLREVPNLRRLSIVAAKIAGLLFIGEVHRLDVLEISHCVAGDVDPVLSHRNVTALRLAAIDGVRSIRAVADNTVLRVLELDRLLHLDSLAPLGTLHSLQSLALRELWQFNVGDAHCIVGLNGLRRLAVDIGGARKNVEIVKRMRLPLAEPFDADDYDLTTS
ncbi:MAG: hypothetical protein JO029_12815 [Candidatus Eremiobacteraeota bacterium]|nr:hypothetical protein [Candidatus Eremiobacteraeota bacterium]